MTDLNATHERMRTWEWEKEIQSWRDRISDVVRQPPPLVAETVDLRMMITTTEAKLQVCVVQEGLDSRDEEAKEKEPSEASDEPGFESLTTKEEVNSLVTKYAQGALRFRRWPRSLGALSPTLGDHRLA